MLYFCVCVAEVSFVSLVVEVCNKTEERNELILDREIMAEHTVECQAFLPCQKRDLYVLLMESCPHVHHVGEKFQ